MVTLVGSGVLSAALLAGYLATESQLAFAHFADSFLDLFATAILVWTVRVSEEPEDKNHHFGHRRAQPLGALVTAVLTGMLAVQVVQGAITSLVAHHEARLNVMLLAMFLAKAVLKAFMLVWGARLQRRAPSPAVKAIIVDSRNDVMSTLLAVVGYFAARNGYTQLDAWLALPVGVAIGWGGLQLALENTRLLMGEAPPASLQKQLLVLAQGVEGVRGTGGLRAHYVGTELHAHIEISVDANLTVGKAHDIGEAVRRTLEADGEVAHCSVHIDPAR
jgi:cation diffusion facilitator family transporter